MTTSADKLARLLADVTRRLDALERAGQLSKSSVEVDGETVPVASGIAAGITAGTVAEAASVAAQEAYDAAHNIGPDQLADDAVVFGKIAVGAVGALALKADAIDGKTINGVEIFGSTVTGSTLQTAETGARLRARPGPSSIGYGEGVLEIFSGNASEANPAEIYTIADGPLSGDNISLYMASPQKTGSLNKRSFIQLFAQDGDTSSQASVAAQIVRLESSQSARVESKNTLGENTELRANADGTLEGYIKGDRKLLVDADGTVWVSDELRVGPSGLTVPRGQTMYVDATGNTGALGTSTGTETAILTANVDVKAGRRYRLLVQMHGQSTVAGDRITYRAFIAGTARQISTQKIPDANVPFGHCFFVSWTAPSDANVNFAVKAYRSSGTGDASINGTVNQPFAIEVVDIGG